MKRILFVDDERSILDGLQDVLRRDRKRWDMVFAESGEDALKLMVEKPADIVVSDMRMPVMSGLELLERVRREYPLAIRFSLSGYADQETVAAASGVAHQQLAKPCETSALRAALERACAVQDTLPDDTLRKVIGTMGGLPTAPMLYDHLKRAMANPDVSVRQLAQIVERDVGISARVLKLVNSAYFGYARHIGNLEEAIVRLGLNTLSHLVLSMEVYGSLPEGIPLYAPAELERHALLSARISRRLVSQPAAKEMAFAAGLLHDAGKFILVTRVPALCEKAAHLAIQDRVPIHVAEKQVMGAHHGEIGAYLLGLWGLPTPVFQAVLSHHEPIPPGGDPEIDLEVTVRMAHALATSAARKLEDQEASTVAGEGSELQPDLLAGWRAMAAEEAEHLIAS